MSTNQKQYEPLGVTSTPLSAMAAFGDEEGGIVLVYRTPDLDQHEDSGVHQAYTMRVLNARGISIGCDRSLRSGWVEGSQIDVRHQMLVTALSFLSAAAEQYTRHGYYTRDEHDEPFLFSERITEWAYMNSDEIAMAESDLNDWLEEYN